MTNNVRRRLMLLTVAAAASIAASPQRSSASLAASSSLTCGDSCTSCTCRGTQETCCVWQGGQFKGCTTTQPCTQPT